MDCSSTVVLLGRQASVLFTPSLLHSPIFDAGFLNVGEGVNKMGNSRETREIKSLVLTHSFLYFTLV